MDARNRRDIWKESKCLQGCASISEADGANRHGVRSILVEILQLAAKHLCNLPQSAELGFC